MPAPTPQRVDSVVRTITTSILAIILVASIAYEALTGAGGDSPTWAQAGVFGLASAVVGFYFGGHVAQNTAALEEARQVQATAASEASALRSEAAAPPREGRR